MDTRISVGKITPPIESVDFFCSDSIKPENHILFALSLTSNMNELFFIQSELLEHDITNCTMQSINWHQEANGSGACSYKHHFPAPRLVSLFYHTICEKVQVLMMITLMIK